MAQLRSAGVEIKKKKGAREGRTTRRTEKVDEGGRDAESDSVSLGRGENGVAHAWFILRQPPDRLGTAEECQVPRDTEEAGVIGVREREPKDK